MVCSSCGSEVAEGSKFCSGCGAKIEDIVAEGTSVSEAADEINEATSSEPAVSAEEVSEEIVEAEDVSEEAVEEIVEEATEEATEEIPEVIPAVPETKPLMEGTTSDVFDFPAPAEPQPSFGAPAAAPVTAPVTAEPVSESAPLQTMPSDAFDVIPSDAAVAGAAASAVIPEKNQKKLDKLDKKLEKKAQKDAKKAQDKADKSRLKFEQQQRIQAVQDSVPSQFKPLRTSSYFWLLFLAGVPVAGFIAVIILSFAGHNQNRKKFVRALLAYYIIGIILFLAACIVLYAINPSGVYGIVDAFLDIFGAVI